MGHNIAMLLDIGSAWTRAVAVDVDAPRVLGAARVPSTPETDVAQGVHAALRELEEGTGVRVRDAAHRLACTSAPGALRLAVVGEALPQTLLVARYAPLTAGARVVATFAGPLAAADADALVEARPHAVLLLGAPNGQPSPALLPNARALAALPLRAPVVMAGPGAARDAVFDALDAAGTPVFITDNVLGAGDALDVAAARQAVMEMYVRRLSSAPGMDRAFAVVDDDITPTSSAVLEAARLLAEGAEGGAGLGEVAAVDVGASTTEVFSVTWQRPTPGYFPRGAPEPFAKRTVEGDLGTRGGAPWLLDAAAHAAAAPAPPQPDLPPLFPPCSETAAALASPRAREGAAWLAAHPHAPPDTPEEQEVEALLARAAADLAMGRHAGHVVEARGLRGTARHLYGKDLRPVGVLIGTGGGVAGPRPRAVLEAALYRSELPASLRPEAPRLLVDRQGLMAPLGLLARLRPGAALRLLAGALEPLA